MMVVFHVILVSCNQHRHVGMVGNVVCHTSGERASHFALSTAAYDDVVSANVRGHRADGCTRIAVRTLNFGIQLWVEKHSSS